MPNSCAKLNKIMEKQTFNPYKIISEPVEGCYEEKKSKFLSLVCPAESEEEAARIINSVKKKNYDARHNCSAMILGPGKELQRSSDDGEPSGTAGKPMLEVLLGFEITNVVAVVTRYFGGVLLGTGGLVRAYSESIKDALTKAVVETITYCVDMDVRISYSDNDSFKYYLDTNSIRILKIDYSDAVNYSLRLDALAEEKMINDITSLTKGSCKIINREYGYRGL